MLGQKINEFDNSDGTIQSFNKIFPLTPLEGEGNVEILNIVDKGFFSNNLYMRNLLVNGEIIEHNFGENNFNNFDDFVVEGNIRFKYIAYDLNNNAIATAYNMQELSDKLGVNINTVKKRALKPIDNTSTSRFRFNIKRKEI